ncbi:hypothetical protein BN1723_004237 [Verticillium longisporum]|uniref:Uncharacterized protein n=1 Tax=Verticillium longisporum TaxID=100787 RepID=A0A0G4M415_VERLO|nr:hypothetical protein BN1708_015390 [Verticillium longisporum]CRK36376.1 hypothetical protein BN1723_004237 [Verticillium longisporum]
MDRLDRGRAAGDGEIEQRTVELHEAGEPAVANEMEQASSWRLGPLSVRRPQPFTRRSADDNAPITSLGNDTDEAGDSPKTPRFNLGFSLPPLRIDRNEGNDQGIPPRFIQQYMIPTAASRAGEVRHSPPMRSSAPMSPVHLAGNRWPDARGSGSYAQESRGLEGGNQQYRRSRQPGRRTWLGLRQPGHAGTRPKRFVFCLPWTASQRARSLAVQCFVSGCLVIMTLTVYLALTVSRKIQQSEFTVLLILMILFAAVFFSHRVVRLCLLVYRPQPEQPVAHEAQHLGIFAVPEEPIRVVLARDEEEGSEVGQQAAKKPKPPPYGAWRQSVRVDPDRIYWQRNPNAVLNEPLPARGDSGTTEIGNAGASRPPSYASEDGVDYVVEARPRSIAPAAMMEMPTPLPVHPSGVGRLNGRQAPW